MLVGGFTGARREGAWPGSVGAGCECNWVGAGTLAADSWTDGLVVGTGVVGDFAAQGGRSRNHPGGSGGASGSPSVGGGVSIAGNLSSVEDGTSCTGGLSNIGAGGVDGGSVEPSPVDPKPNSDACHAAHVPSGGAIGVVSGGRWRVACGGDGDSGRGAAGVSKREELRLDPAGRPMNASTLVRR